MDRMLDELNSLEKNSLLRELKSISEIDDIFVKINGKKYLDFSSNDYLNLSSYPEIIEKSIEATKKFGVGSRASRLLSGNLELFDELEHKIARFKNKEAALVFNSGYQANVSLFAALFEDCDVIFADKFIHASIIDGLKLSPAKFFRFRHNDLSHLENLLKANRSKFKRALVATESVFSMDGDIAPLVEIVNLKKKYDFEIFVDEAHATGIFGKNGSGIIEQLNLTRDIDYILGTFSKALGSFGAYFASTNLVKKYLINKSRSFIFSTALPPGVIAANIASLNIVKNEMERRKILIENSDFFRNLLKQNFFEIKGETQITPILFRDEAKTLQIAQNLQKIGYFVIPIRYPSVPKNEARLRISLTYKHSRDFLEKFVSDLKKIV